MSPVRLNTECNMHKENDLKMEKVADKNCAETKKDDSDKKGSLGWIEFGCNDYWTWSKRHRSKEVILVEPTARKGMLQICQSDVEN